VGLDSDRYYDDHDYDNQDDSYGRSNGMATLPPATESVGTVVGAATDTSSDS
jgi:hypothetical protein